jgi:hypothetical protein
LTTAREAAEANEVRSDEKWQVVEPSKLDLAVKRAQELADEYGVAFDVPLGAQTKQFHELLAMFRAAQ